MHRGVIERRSEGLCVFPTKSTLFQLVMRRYGISTRGISNLSVGVYHDIMVMSGGFVSTGFQGQTVKVDT